jgi:hypothetical protein
MIKPFDELYEALERSLAEMDQDVDDSNRYLKCIELVRGTFLEMRALGMEFLKDSQREVEYFRSVWPWFYGKLLFYIRLQRFEQSRLALPERALKSMMAGEEQRVAKFFRINGEFWLYYQCDAASLNEQFTRAYSRGRLFEPLALVIDPDGATLGSYRAAWCLAMAFYKGWLANERDRMASAGELSDYSWDSTDADYVEWLYGFRQLRLSNIRVSRQISADWRSGGSWCWENPSRVFMTGSKSCVIERRKGCRL